MKTCVPITLFKCLVLLSLLISSSCKDENAQPTKPPKELLQGEWHKANEYYRYYDEKGKLLFQVSGIVVAAYFEFTGDTLKISYSMPDPITNKYRERSSPVIRPYWVEETEEGTSLTIGGLGGPRTYQLEELSDDRFILQQALDNTTYYVKEEDTLFKADKAIYQVVFKRGFIHGNLPERKAGRP